MECYICKKNLAGRFYRDSWGHEVCASHIESGEYVQCSSCTGFAQKSGALSDGRVFCPVCTSTAVKVGDNIDPILNVVLKSLSRVGFDNLETDNVTVETVSAQTMSSVRGDSIINTNNKGLTRSQVSGSYSIFAGKSRKVQHTIYMLEYQPKVQYAGTLAHELLHAWQVQNSIKPPAPLCEGFCNLAAYHVMSILPSSLSKVLMKNMMESPDPIYGDGFREVYAMYEELEWSGVIDFYKENKF